VFRGGVGIGFENHVTWCGACKCFNQSRRSGGGATIGFTNYSAGGKEVRVRFQPITAQGREEKVKFQPITAQVGVAGKGNGLLLICF